MFLSREEEAMLDGEHGEAVAKLMRLLVTLGEIYEADRMLRVSSVHVSGVSFKNLGEDGLALLEELASGGARARVKATLNPGGMDYWKWKLMGIPEDFALKQKQIYRVMAGMGLMETFTCTPYEAGNLPRAGEHVAWAESSAEAYVNSVVAARTNRESGLSALASAITGRTPNYGLHLEENRRPTVVFSLDFQPQGALEFGALGYLIGLTAGSSVPYIQGVKKAGREELKALGAAAASSGAVALYHLENLTPEASKMEKHLKGLEKIKVSREDLERVAERFSAAGEFDCVFLGCPHCNLEKVRLAAEALKGEKVKGRLWVCTSRSVYREAERLGYVEALEGAGALVLRDTCLVVAPLSSLGFKRILTDSFKAAHYLSSAGLEVSLAETEECLRRALEG